jgi:uncharacterized protein (TIGR00251 family)
MLVRGEPTSAPLVVYPGRVSAATRIRFRVSPGASRAGVVGRHGEGWKVRVTQAAEDGKANDALVRLLAETLEVPRTDVAIVSGLASRDKIVAVTGVDSTRADAALERAAVGRVES